MRIQKLVIAASALLLLSGCSDSKFHDFGAWYNNKPSRMEKKWGPMTSGYFGQNAAGRAVLKPPGLQAPTKEELNPPLVDGDVVAVAPVPANQDVTVFPVEQDDTGVMPHHVIEENGTEPAPVVSEAMPANYGQKIDQLYFAHGSARIGAHDSKHLAVVANKAMRRQNPNLTVVGHASHRVNTTDDPVRKKEINFEMAQKRANAVTNALTRQGIDPGWVMAVSKGDEEPNMHRGKRSQEAADRRVEVFVNGQK